jgi:hypothetical protein
MKKIISGMLPMLFLLGIVAATASAKENTAEKATITQAEVLQLVRDLQKKTESMQRRHAIEIKELHAEITRLKGEQEVTGPEEGSQVGEESLYESIKAKVHAPLKKSSLTRGLELDASVVIDGFYYHEDSDEGMAHLKEEVNGFGHSHGDDDHAHGEVENGFNLRHIELGLSAEVDPYFRAWTTLAIDDDSSEIEEAVMQTTSLPAGFTLSGGKFLSGIGRLNRQHSHNWDFFDQPLVYELLLGSHNLQEKGLQATWLVPTPFYLLFGVEALNGENEKMFQKVDADELPDHDGPRLWTGFLKFGPDFGPQHAMQMGLSYANGHHQEAHDGNSDGTDDHWLDGRSHLYGIDFVYKYDAKKSHGHGNIVLQAEYLNRKKDLNVEQHDLVPALTGRDKIDRQDGYYLQGTYGLAPNWRAGLRWEQVGLTNETEFPDLTEEDYGSSDRLAAMIDWKASEFSLVRLQSAYVDFETNEADETAWEIALQWQVTFGKHAAHNF